MQQETIGDLDNYVPLTPVPAHRRAFATSDAFALWFSLGIGLLVAQAGALLVPGLPLPHALMAIAIGTVIGVVLLSLAGVVGTDTGLQACRRSGRHSSGRCCSAFSRHCSR